MTSQFRVLNVLDWHNVFTNWHSAVRHIHSSYHFAFLSHDYHFSASIHNLFGRKMLMIKMPYLVNWLDNVSSTRNCQIEDRCLTYRINDILCGFSDMNLIIIIIWTYQTHIDLPTISKAPIFLTHFILAWEWIIRNRKEKYLFLIFVQFLRGSTKTLICK